MQSPQQLSLVFSPKQITIASASCLQNAWQWIVSQMTPRPSSPQSLCIFDQKYWRLGRKLQPLCVDDICLDKWADLYLTSQFNDLRTILDMVNTGTFCDVIVYGNSIDPDIRSVIDSARRFRNSLSEHMAFWVRLATEAQLRNCSKFGCSLPNIQPEEKGPDGLFMGLGAVDRVEIHSVKNSIGDPSRYIVSPSFRKYGIPKRGKQLDDFWLKANRNLGLAHLDRMLSQVLDSLDVNAQQSIRMALLSQCNYNAVIVANNAFAKIKSFEGYQRVTPDATRRIATYIGATKWKEFAEKTRRRVKQKLVRAGVW